MERFLIDDGIKQSKIVANRYKWSAENADMGSEDANELHADICNQYVKEYEQIAEWLEELKSYKDIGTLKELKELKENGTFTGLELAKLAIMQKELKEYKDLILIVVVYHVAIVEHYKYYGLTKNMKNQKLIGLMCLLIR